MVETEDTATTGRHAVSHWATLVNGLERAWLDKKNKHNKNVMDAIAKGTDAKVYKHTMPTYGKRFLRDAGDLANKSTTSIAQESTELDGLELWPVGTRG